MQLAALTASCTVVLSCTADDQPISKDAPLDTLPSDAVGVVSVGPIQPPIISDRGRATFFAFDDRRSGPFRARP
ncbi:hypothetical protein [Nocardia sp. NPDC024068]|uniref:hypothetical protein n=1 Tax=Nocardia sp. NPDC024068 TaxID=3157197 RepID=UPI0033EB0713